MYVAARAPAVHGPWAVSATPIQAAPDEPKYIPLAMPNTFELAVIVEVALAMLLGGVIGLAPPSFLVNSL